MGVFILTQIDYQEQALADRNAVKRSMLANGNFDHKQLFPEYFATKEDKETQPATEDYSAVEWKTPSEDIDEYKRLMALLGQSTGQMTGDTVIDDTNGHQKQEIEWSDWS